MTVNRSMIQKLLLPGIHAIAGLSYKKIPEEHAPMFEILTSRKSAEEEVYMSGMGGAPVKPEGSAVQFDDIQQAWSAKYVHDTIAVGFGVTKEALDDDLYDGISRAKAQELGSAMADTKQVRAAAIFNNGFNPAFAGGDGTPLFADDHPLSGGGTYSNKMSADLSEAALEEALLRISKTTNDRGLLITNMPELIVIPSELEYRLERILKSPLSTTLGPSNQTNVNDINAIQSLGKFSKGAHVNRRLTDPDAWFIRCSIPNGTKMFVREKLQASTDTDFSTDNMLFKFRERYSFGWTDFRQWFGSEGS